MVDSRLGGALPPTVLPRPRDRFPNHGAEGPTDRIRRELPQRRRLFPGRPRSNPAGCAPGVCVIGSRCSGSASRLLALAIEASCPCRLDRDTAAGSNGRTSPARRLAGRARSANVRPMALRCAHGLAGSLGVAGGRPRRRSKFPPPQLVGDGAPSLRLRPIAGPPDAGPRRRSTDPHRMGPRFGPFPADPVIVYGSAQGLLEAPISASVDEGKPLGGDPAALYLLQPGSEGFRRYNGTRRSTLRPGFTEAARHHAVEGGAKGDASSGIPRADTNEAMFKDAHSLRIPGRTWARWTRCSCSPTGR